MIHPRQNQDVRRILSALKKPRKQAFKNDFDHGKPHALVTLAFGEKLVRDPLYRDKVNKRAAAIALLVHDIGSTINRFPKASQTRREKARKMHEPWGAHILTNAMMKAGYDAELISEVADAVKTHDSGPHETLLSKLVSDADKLALFPNGVKRVLNFARTKGGGQPLYTPAKWNLRTLKPVDGASIDPFYVLFSIAKLPENKIYSTTAKKEVVTLRRKFVEELTETIKGHKYEKEMLTLLAKSKAETWF
ncbi:MAG: HD domain-containing protein [Candidatus Micrarchaeota archaeon]